MESDVLSLGLKSMHSLNIEAIGKATNNTIFRPVYASN